MSDEYPGVKRLRVRFTDPGEIDFDWPFVALEREIASIEVDGEKWVPETRIEKLADANGYLCAEVNRLQKLVDEAEHTCKNAAQGYKAYYFVCSKCGWNLVNVKRDSIELAAAMINRCPHCGAKVVDA